MDILSLFRERRALLEGHFQLSSGLHSPNYLQCALVLQYPDVAAALGSQLAQKIRNEAALPHFVMSPALGGLIIGHEVARALGVRFLFAERDQARLAVRRGFELTNGETCVVVEDVITTGGSSQEIIDLTAAAGVRSVAVACIIDRSGGCALLRYQDQPLSLLSLIQLTIPTYPPESCPLCREGSAAVKPGSKPV